MTLFGSQLQRIQECL